MMPAVQVLIDRLKSNPEDFFGDISTSHLMRSPKFSDIIEKLDDLLAVDLRADNNLGVDVRRFHRLWFLDKDETTALLDAYKEARRTRFEAQIFSTLLSPELNEEEEMMKYKAQGRYAQQLGASMVTTKNHIIGTIQSGFGSAQVKREGGAVE
jgi:hypothetical protein